MTDRSLASLGRTCSLALLLLASGCGWSNSDRHRRAFEKADLNKDGFVSYAELEADVSSKLDSGRGLQFENADHDGDNRLTPEEFRTIPNGHRVLWALGIFSAISFVGSLIAIPIVVARLPIDHFVAPHEAADWVASDIRRRLWLVLKNFLGILLIAGGIIMLVLPGQGALTILLGIALTDFPGKWKMMRALARRPEVMKALNWMRERANQPPLLPPEKEVHHEPPPA